MAEPRPEKKLNDDKYDEEKQSLLEHDGQVQKKERPYGWDPGLKLPPFEYGMGFVIALSLCFIFFLPGYIFPCLAPVRWVGPLVVAFNIHVEIKFRRAVNNLQLNCGLIDSSYKPLLTSTRVAKTFGDIAEQPANVSDGNYVPLVPGLLQLICQTMKQYENDKDVQVKGCQALLKIASTDQHKDIIESAGVLDKLDGIAVKVKFGV